MSALRQLAFRTEMDRYAREGRASANGSSGMIAGTFVKLAADRARKSGRRLADAQGFDRAAIMAEAWSQARVRRNVGAKEPWSVILSQTLKGVWQVAKAARIAAAH